ncbi:LysR family transcriptional regulator [Radicibacter daui]|uniref:LysR family transcriptional regulator n=1 Tax=Radicibacter daui TaxID=3064829 RepID=UPI00404692DE
MKRDELGDLAAFLAVVEDGSFTKAAARIGTSQSALSHTLRRLEERLGVRLLTRTTRRVAPTQAGEQLASTLRPAFDDIGARLQSLTALRQQPAGTIRLTSSKFAADRIVFPAAAALMADYPEIRIEISIDQRLTDIVAERFDAGVRLGDQVQKDMIAVPIGPPIRMVVAGSPAYFAAHGKPESPQALARHNCLNLRLPTLGGLYPWEFERDGRPVNVRVEGQFTCNDPAILISAAIRGLGLICLPDDHLGPLVEEGKLEAALEDWSAPFAGYHLYYPSRRQQTPAFELLVQRLRYRPDVGQVS